MDSDLVYQTFEFLEKKVNQELEVKKNNKKKKMLSNQILFYKINYLFGGKISIGMDSLHSIKIS